MHLELCVFAPDCFRFFETKVQVTFGYPCPRGLSALVQVVPGDNLYGGHCVLLYNIYNIRDEVEKDVVTRQQICALAPLKEIQICTILIKGYKT